MKRKKILGPVSCMLFWLLGASCLTAVEVDGILAVELGFENHYRQIEMEQHKKNLDVFMLPFALYGAAPDYSIESKIAFGDLAHLRETYLGAKEGLTADEYLWTSFGSMQIAYLLDQYGPLRLMPGFRIGHQGLLFKRGDNLFTNQDGSVYHLYAAAVLNNKMILNRFSMVNLQLDLPLALWREGFKSFFNVNVLLELVFDPLGSIAEPANTAAFFSLGCRYGYYNFSLDQNADKKYQLHELQPFLKVDLFF